MLGVCGSWSLNRDEKKKHVNRLITKNDAGVIMQRFGSLLARGGLLHTEVSTLLCVPLPHEDRQKKRVGPALGDLPAWQL